MTRRWRHALVIGKFYPPHRGHHALIAQAARRAERVTVVVMASGAESVPLEERVRWLRLDQGMDHPAGGVRVVGVRCESPVDVSDETVWAAQVAAMRSAVRVAAADSDAESGPDAAEFGSVDVVVSGEVYGEKLAGYFDAAHVTLDRRVEGFSATAVRSDLAAHWDDLTPATRAGLACRVVFVGAESTGTTTLAEAIGAHYRERGGVWARTEVVAEYGRDYTDRLWESQRAAARARGLLEPALADVTWSPDDFDRVAAGQTADESQAAAAGSPLLVCDTDAWATSIWERRYLGAGARIGQAWARPPALPRHSLYLLTSHRGVPWVDDGIREGDLEIRADMTDWFADALTRERLPWVMLEGSLTERIGLAIRSIEPVLERHLRFGDPLSGPGFPA